MASGFSWDSEGRTAVTLDELGQKDMLVLMRFTEEKVIVSTLELDREELCRPVEVSSCALQLYLEDAVFEAGDHPALRFTLGQPRHPFKTVKTVPLSGFTTIGERPALLR